jgi:hypothetical protein
MGLVSYVVIKTGHRYSAPIATPGADEDTHQVRGKSASDRPLFKG